MTMFIQLHLLTAYPPSNLNRDDTGRPKSCVFGGTPRLRISSQSLKRAWRTSDVFHGIVKGHVGQRTQRVGKLVFDHLTSRAMAPDKATATARAIADVFGKVKSKEDKAPSFTEQLVFVAPEERQRAITLADRALAGETVTPEADDLLVKTDTATDIAMFGRMLADDPSYNREAAAQVAHALTTNKVVIEDDYYVAVDDLKNPLEREDAGTSFIGTTEYGAGMFYLYACIDADLLKRNLGGNASLAADAAEALLRSAAQVAPRGKQASFASRARACHIVVEKGPQQPRSLAAAFLKSVGNSEGDGDLAVASIRRLKVFRAALDRAYGPNADAKLTMTALPALGRGSLDQTVAFVREAVLQ